MTKTKYNTNRECLNFQRHIFYWKEHVQRLELMFENKVSTQRSSNSPSLPPIFTNQQTEANVREANCQKHSFNFDFKKNQDQSHHYFIFNIILFPFLRIIPMDDIDFVIVCFKSFSGKIVIIFKFHDLSQKHIKV